MRKLKYLFIVLLLLIIPNHIVKADGISINLVGEDTINDTIDIYLEVSEIEGYVGFYGLTGVLEYDNALLELISIKGLNNFNLTYNGDNKKIVLYSPRGIDNKSNVIHFQFRNIGLDQEKSTDIKISDIVASDSKNDIKINNISKEIKSVTDIVKDINTNNYLSSININGKELEVDKNNLTYDIIVSYDTKEITINSISDNENAMISGNGIHKLEVGSNEIELKVKDENDNDNDRTYIIDVTREDKDSKIDEEDLFIGHKNKKVSRNYLVIIPIVIIIVIILFMIIKRRRGKR